MYISKKILYVVGVLALLLVGGFTVHHLTVVADNSLQVNNVAEATTNNAVVAEETVQVTSPYTVQPPKPKDKDIAAWLNEGYSQPDAILFATFEGGDTDDGQGDDFRKKRVLEIQQNFMSPNAPLSRTDPIAYLKTRGYSEHDAKILLGGYEGQDLLMQSNDDFDDSLERGKVASDNS